MNVLCLEYDPDVFNISEHGFNNRNIQTFILSGHRLSSNYFRKNSKGGGTVIFTKDSIKQYSIQLLCENLGIERSFEISDCKNDIMEYDGYSISIF